MYVVYLSLKNRVTFISHLQDKIKGVHHLLLSGSLQLNVNGDEATSTTYSSTAVDKEWFLVGVGMGVSDPPQEVEQRGGVTRDTKIWP